MYFTRKGIEPEKENKTASGIGILESGTDRHDRIQHVLDSMKDLGMEFEYIDVETYVKEHNLSDIEIIEKKGMETKCFNKRYNMSFLTDGIIKYLPENKYYIFEFKTEISQKFQSREKEELLHIVEGLSESNPMMGLRGCRLGLTYPEINEMQVRAIFSAACDLKKEGVNVKPYVMIPLFGHVNELKTAKDILVRVANEVMTEKGVNVEYKFGTMIEIPRAALTSSEVAEYAEFFSYGTNDLTQMTFGYSRDDAEGKFLKNYVEQKILPANPFVTLDQKGVGRLIEMSIKEGKEVNPSLIGGICGEHGGDPDSVKFAHKIGLNYVSCSPYRIPQARLAAAQAVIEQGCLCNA